MSFAGPLSVPRHGPGALLAEFGPGCSVIPGLGGERHHAIEANELVESASVPGVR